MWREVLKDELDFDGQLFLGAVKDLTPLRCKLFLALYKYYGPQELLLRRYIIDNYIHIGWTLCVTQVVAFHDVCCLYLKHYSTSHINSLPTLFTLSMDKASLNYSEEKMARLPHDILQTLIEKIVRKGLPLSDYFIMKHYDERRSYFLSQPTSLPGLSKWDLHHLRHFNTLDRDHGEFAAHSILIVRMIAGESGALPKLDRNYKHLINYLYG